MQTVIQVSYLSFHPLNFFEIYTLSPKEKRHKQKIISQIGEILPEKHMAALASPSLGALFRNHSFFTKPPSRSPVLRSPPRWTTQRSAIRGWRDYEEAVKRRDLAGALNFLKSMETEEIRIERSNESSSSRLRELGFREADRDWEVLDTCLNADDMRLVANAYGFLKNRGFLTYFGKFRSIGNPFHSSSVRST